MQTAVQNPQKMILTLMMSERGERKNMARGSFGTCSKCGKRIIWIKTKAGKNMPCDPAFVHYVEQKGGKDRIVLSNGDVVVGTVQDYAENTSGYGYISHFATCEAAKMFRRKRKAADS